MNVEELVGLFPEIPVDLREEATLAAFAAECGDLLAKARKPSACSTGHDASNHYYLRLIGPLSIYGFGLSTREKLITQLEELIERHRTDPNGFAASLLPEGVVQQEIHGPGCD